MYETWVTTYTSKHLLRKLFESISWEGFLGLNKKIPSHQVWLDDFGCLGVDPLWELNLQGVGPRIQLEMEWIHPYFLMATTKCLVNCGFYKPQVEWFHSYF